jgi:hypothetical protein
VPENIWATCTGPCRQPVSKYTRSFVYDDIAKVVFLIDRVDLVRSRPTGLRFRTQNPSLLSTLVNYDTVSVPSDKGNYRTLIRVLKPANSAPWTIEKEPWATTVPSWQIDLSMVGSQVRKTFATALQHRIITVLHLDKSSIGNTTLNNAALISSTSGSIGGCASSFCFVTANSNTVLSTTVNYTTPSTMPANTRHVVADLTAGGCYAVTSSVSGTIATSLPVNANDNTLLFVVPNSGTQVISVAKC